MNAFLTSNTPAMRCARTIVQGVIGALIMYLPDVMGLWHLDPTVNALGVAVIMAVLSPVMAAIGEAGGNADDQ